MEIERLKGQRKRTKFTIKSLMAVACLRKPIVLRRGIADLARKNAEIRIITFRNRLKSYTLLKYFFENFLMLKNRIFFITFTADYFLNELKNK
jgi:hypothetical protein